MNKQEQSQGMMLASAQNMQYYPTDVREVYRMITQLWRWDVKINMGGGNPIMNEAIKEFTLLIQRYNIIQKDIGNGEEFIPYIEPLGLTLEDVKGILNGMREYTQLFGSTITRRQIGQCMVKYFIESEQYHLIEKLLISDAISTSRSKRDEHRRTMNIIDPFAGEGEWLALFKDVPLGSYATSKLGAYRNAIVTVANEIEVNRYNKCKKNKLIDISTNLAFEDFEAVPNSFGLILFNPPYGETNGVRNTHHYLKMLTERRMLLSESTPLRLRRGMIIMVLRGDDFLLSAEYIAQNYYIKRMYQVNEEEYERYKQFVLFAEARHEPLEINQNTIRDIQDGVDFIEYHVQNNIKFDPSYYYEDENTDDIFLDETYLEAPYESIIKESIEIDKHIKNRSRLNNRNWSDIKELTSLSRADERSIVKPTPLSLGEVANLISSGLINGRIKSEKGEFNVVGGIKSGMLTTIDEEENKEIKTIYSTPYLNILTTDEKGNTIMKELNVEPTQIEEEI